MKKIISLLILLSLILTSAAMPAFASDNGDLDFAKAFGLISEETAADTPLTRIELAEIFYNIIFPTQNIQSTYWGEADYPDVPAEAWPLPEAWRCGSHGHRHAWPHSGTHREVRSFPEWVRHQYLP